MSLLIIDGNNVMGARPWTRWWRDRDRAAEDLRAELEAVDGEVLATSEGVLLVFDGRASRGASEESGGLDVRYAGDHGSSADDLIVELVGEAGGAVSVVTSDRELARRVAEHGARVEGAGAFLGRVGLGR